MTTYEETIPTGSTSVDFTLGAGSYTVTAVAGKYATIEQQFTVAQSDIEDGAMEIDLGDMEMGTHTFHVVVNCDDDGEFTAKLKLNNSVVETKQTVNKVADFTVTATEHGSSAVNYVIEVSRAGYKTVTQSTDATVDEFRAAGSETVTIAAGSNVVTLTVKVVADAAVTVTVQ